MKNFSPNDWALLGIALTEKGSSWKKQEVTEILKNLHPIVVILAKGHSIKDIVHYCENFSHLRDEVVFLRSDNSNLSADKAEADKDYYNLLGELEEMEISQRDLGRKEWELTERIEELRDELTRYRRLVSNMKSIIGEF